MDPPNDIKETIRSLSMELSEAFDTILPRFLEQKTGSEYVKVCALVAVHSGHLREAIARGRELIEDPITEAEWNQLQSDLCDVLEKHLHRGVAM